MCEFCHKHGDGEKWYLQAKNYGEDLTSDLRRRRIIEEMLLSSETVERGFRWLDRIENAPKFIQVAIKGLMTNKLKRDHFGQVVPIEDIETIFGFVNSIVQVPCICRYLSTGEEAGYCYGLTLGPNGDQFADLLSEVETSFGEGPDTSRLEELDPAEALEKIKAHETEGLAHTIWTIGTPLIGGLCNCDRVDCLAMQATVQRGLKAMWRGEYVADVDAEKCTGCRECMRLCQFGAMGYSAMKEKVLIDPRACWGCGTCRSGCPHDAISLTPRTEVPAAARVW